MTATSRPDPGPADKLAELLETVSPEVRREITAWLLRTGHTSPPTTGSAPWLAPPLDPHLPAPAAEEPVSDPERVRRLAGSLPAGGDSQVVTLRLPAERHAALREWCAGHGFSMATVVRGLVERFLENQARPT